MNKILVSKDKLSINSDSDISYLVKEVNLDISSNVTINDVTKTGNDKICINVLDDSNVTYYKDKIVNDIDIFINLNNNSTLRFYVTSKINKEYKINIYLNIMGNDNNADIGVRSICEGQGRVSIRVDGTVKDDTINNKFKEDIRILHLNDLRSMIIPNMIINTNNVEATHNAVISGIDKRDLFYLSTKGIDKLTAINLLKKSFLNIKREVE